MTNNELVPNVMTRDEAKRLEQVFLSGIGVAQAAYERIVDTRAWLVLGFDTFADWWQARVQPTMRALSMRPTREIAAVAIEQIKSEEADLPPTWRRSQAEVGELVGVSGDTVARITGSRSPRDADAPGDDLDTPNIDTFDAIAVSTGVIVTNLPTEQQRNVVAVADKKVITGLAKEIKLESREERQREKRAKVEEIRNTIPPPIDSSTRFSVLYADPPWRYEHSETTTREIENHYPTMTLDEIKDMDVPAADDAVLFLWVTSPKLIEGLEVLDAWGFQYRTCMVWIKDRIGMGYYARQQHELLLIGKRGALPVPDPEDRPSSVIHGPRGEHSAKPDEVYELIERMYPTRSKFELFQRRERTGWLSWGTSYDYRGVGRDEK